MPGEDNSFGQDAADEVKEDLKFELADWSDDFLRLEVRSERSFG